MRQITQGVLLLVLPASLFAQAEKTTSEKLEERYFGTLEGG
jgi:hypothetical protein